MSSKLSVGIISVIVLFVVGNILLFGLLKNDIASFSGINSNDVLFPLAYLIMCLAIMVFVINKLVMLKEPSDTLFFMFCGIVLCFALTFSATATKVYYDEISAASDLKEQSLNELKEIQLMDDYHTQFITYLNDQLLFYQNSSKNLEDKIDYNLKILKIKSDEQKAMMELQTIIEPVDPIVTEPYYEEVNYYESDEEWDDD